MYIFFERTNLFETKESKANKTLIYMNPGFMYLVTKRVSIL